MAVRTTLRSGDSAALASPALIPLLLLCCSAGTVGQVYTFNPGDDVTGTIGGGIGTDAVEAMLRETGGLVRAVPCTPTWSGAPSIVHVGTGPTVTCALASSASGCFDDYAIKMRVKTGGNGGAGASIDVAYDGATYVENVQIPAENPAVLRGTVDITYGMTLSALTMVYTAPAAKTLTFGAGSLAATVAGLKAATATVAAIVTLHASDLIAAQVALVNAANGAKLVFTTAGTTPSDAPVTVIIAGNAPDGTASAGEVLNLSQVAGAVTSANRYRLDADLALTYAEADGVAATIAIGNAATFGTGAEIVAAYNALAAASPLALRARLASTTTAQYLETYSTAVGAAVTETLDDATSTAEALLGFSSGASNLTATGSAATVTLPWTGLTFTFPASAVYVVGDTYAATCTGPRASLASLAAGFTAARDAYRQTPFGFAVVAQPAPDAGTCAATEVALAALAAGWLADPTNAIFVTHVTGAPFFVASPVRATNNANILTADAALLLACNATAANFGNIATCDVYLPGATSLHAGSFRRTAALAWGAKHAAAAKLAADVGDGLVSEATLLGPDLLTYARDDNTAVTKLGQGSGPGFSALAATAAGNNYVQFKPGATRAGNTSRLRYIGPLTVGLAIAYIVYPYVSRWQGQTDLVGSDNQLTDKAKKQRGEEVRAQLAPTLTPDGQPANVSGFTVEILNPLAGTFLDSGQLRIKVSYRPLGEIEDVYIDIVASGAGVTIS